MEGHDCFKLTWAEDSVIVYQLMTLSSVGQYFYYKSSLKPMVQLNSYGDFLGCKFHYSSPKNISAI